MANMTWRNCFCLNCHRTNRPREGENLFPAIFLYVNRSSKKQHIIWMDFKKPFPHYWRYEFMSDSQMVQLFTSTCLGCDKTGKIRSHDVQTNILHFCRLAVLKGRSIKCGNNDVGALFFGVLCVKKRNYANKLCREEKSSFSAWITYSR